jgi:hypothetical protein
MSPIGIDPVTTTKNLTAMADGYDGHLPTILLNSKFIPAKYSPMTDNEFLGYMANLEGILDKYISFQSDPKTQRPWTPNEFSTNGYTIYLQSVKAAANKMNDVVNKDMTLVDDKSSKTTETPTGPSEFEKLLKNQPQLAEALKKTITTPKLLLKYASIINEQELFKTKEEALLDIINDKQLKFFNKINPTKKMLLVGELLTAGITNDNIKIILKIIVSSHIENNFSEVPPFDNNKTLIEMIKGKKPTEITEQFDKIKSSIFDKSKF